MKPCKQPKECKAHTSFTNLKNLSKILNMIWRNPKKFSKDWENDNHIHTRKKGYLNMASNYPRIWKEIEKIKHVIRIFNISRSNLKNYSDKIKNQLSIEDLTKGTIRDTIKIGHTKSEDTLPREDSPTMKRMKNKFTYSRSEFKKISIDAFKLESVQTVLKKWEKSN